MTAAPPHNGSEGAATQGSGAQAAQAAEEAGADHGLRVLVVAPTRRDGEVTAALLAEQGIECAVLNRLQDVAVQMQAGIGALVLTDMALGEPGIDDVVAVLAAQPAWSDVPALVLTRDRAYSPTAVRAFGTLGNVVLLDRPSSTRSMVSAVKSALRARRKQYQIRDQLVAQRQAEAALVKADRRKDEFLATLAHELRNPLAAIRTGLDVILRDRIDNPRTERMVQMMDRQSRLLIKLIDELMDVSRIATGKVELERLRLDLRAVVEAGLEGQSVFDAARHDIRTALPAEPVWISGDASRLAQVVGNLVNNAVKYTPDGGRVSISVSQEGADAVLNVADSGVGIPPEMLDQVFEMFTQVDRTLDRAQGGLGIGLSLVRRLVALHGGAVTAQSAGVGLGSRFTVRLPTVAPPAAEAAAALTAAAPAARALKVLVVDDNRDVADCMAELLDVGGNDVRCAYDGRSALSMADDFMPDIVFCDVGMPDINGHELARRLRANPKHATAYLVAVTGWGNDDDKRQCEAAGFDRHFTKPIGYEQVEAVLARF